MATKKPRKKKGELQWVCNNPGRAFDLATLVGMLENQESGFANFFFPVLKDAMANDPAAIACVNSYLAPDVDELEDLGIPASQIDAMRKCTDSSLLVAVIAQKNT